jgi:AcrR family transcriptional regulator
VPTQAERTEATRTRLITAARRLFADQGFAATSTEEILEASQVTRGAMYHQFESKADLFRATFEAVEVDFTAKVREAAASASGPANRLRMGFVAFLDLCRDPEVQRIVMIDGPTVLGWDTWHEINERYAFGLLRSVFTSAAKDGSIQSFMVDPLAHLLMGAMMQAGLVVARADNPAAAKVEMTATFDLILSGLTPRA